MFRIVCERFYEIIQQYRKGEWNINDRFLTNVLKTLTHLLSFQPSTVMKGYYMFYWCYDGNIYSYASLPFQYILCFHPITILLCFRLFYKYYASKLYFYAYLLFEYTIEITEIILLWIIFPSGIFHWWLEILRAHWVFTILFPEETLCKCYGQGKHTYTRYDFTL